MDDCVFCNIVNKTIESKSKFLYENEKLVVIKDILPKAPVHLLVIPKKHITGIADLQPDDRELVGEMIFIAKQMAEAQQVNQTGYKLIFNVGRDGGQVVPHLHLHLLGGKQLGE